jgi:hypothetical protein
VRPISGETSTTITSENAKHRTCAVRDTAQGNKNRTITEAIKKLFRETGKTFARRDVDEPQPEQRRRRNGETDRSFGPASRAILRRAIKLPSAAYAGATFLSDALDWLNLWRVDPVATRDPDAAIHTETNHLFPHF